MTLKSVKQEFIPNTEDLDCLVEVSSSSTPPSAFKS
jgi:hypothetical protein